MCRLSCSLGVSNSWNPQDLSRPVIGLLYLLPLSMQVVAATGEHLVSSTNHETAHCAIFAASFCFLRIRPQYLTQHPIWWLILLKIDSCLQHVKLNTNEKSQMKRNVWDIYTPSSYILVHWHSFYVSFYHHELLQIRSRWPHSLRRGSTASRLLGFRGRIPSENGWLSVMSVLCCQLELSASDWSLV